MLKVDNSSQDMPMQQMPPMDMQPEMGDNMGGSFMPQDNMQQSLDGGMEQMPNQFGADFDAGVEADEEQDPKKFIQQLTGKLSQSLQKYNDNNGQPDVDLNKYVAGMITKQAMKGLSEEDAEEIIDKVKADEDFSMDDGGNEQQPQDSQMGDNMQQQGQDMMPQDDMQQQPPMNENFFKRQRGKQIREIVNGVLGNHEEDTPRQQPKYGSDTYRTSAYTSPNFVR